MYFLLTRPEEDTKTLAQSLSGMGHKIQQDPLLSIHYADRPKIDLANFQAVLFTSANGVRAFIRTSSHRNISCFCVGQATAHQAKMAGFQNIITSRGNVDRLAEQVIGQVSPDNGPLLHVSGTDVAGNLSGQLSAAGLSIQQTCLYHAIKSKQLSPKTIKLISEEKITHIPLYSPRTAETLVSLIQSAGLQNKMGNITALCLSSAVSNVIKSLDWQEILVADHPDQTHLFNLISLTLEESRS